MGIVDTFSRIFWQYSIPILMGNLGELGPKLLRCRSTSFA